MITSTATAGAQTRDELIAFLRARWQASSAYTRAIAEQLPAEKYQFRPTPEQMTFAEQLLHIAEQDRLILNEMGASIAATRPSPDRAGVLQALREIEAHGIRVLDLLAKKDSASLIDVLNGFMLALDHTTHHRAQLVVYLRLNGITPAEYRR